ncbi:MAG: DNA mismatch repair protein MutS [Acholeplasmatales bacterium]|nr:DNA mismatch repair protein MutS [Acholeplasmatales bacterium]
MEFKDIDRSQYTPMMQQYLDIKKDYVDTLVFFRLGDFYEMFFNDAYIASKELELCLTGRDAGAKERVPMCGIPHMAVNTYIDKLTEKGYKVAIVEQLEEPGVSKIVRRDVVRLVTPGTNIDEGSVSEKKNNYLVAVSENKGEYAICYIDFTTGESYGTKIINSIDLLVNEILILSAKEVVLPSRFNKIAIDVLKNKYQIVISVCDDVKLEDYWLNLVKNVKDADIIESFGRLINYIIKTQKRELMHLKCLEYYSSKQFLKMDIHTLNSLELLENLRNQTRIGSLLYLLDHCQTAMGSRELKKWITRPLIDKSKIFERYDIVGNLINNFELKESIIASLKNVYDLERIVGRISYGNANARDLLQLKNSLKYLPELKEYIKEINTNYSTDLSNMLDPLIPLHDLLEKSINVDAPITIKDGDIIKSGYNEELDKLRDITKNGKNWLIEYEAKQKEATGIKTLKVSYNKVFGYYIEISKAAALTISDDLNYVRKQTLANAERFITPELKEYESLILNSKDKSIELEYELFVEIRNECAKFINNLQIDAKVVSIIDCLTSFAYVSDKNNYVKPTINDNLEINIVDGRHPVIEELSDEAFVSNDFNINKNYNMLLITGPNMSGKSTYMRQLAITVIMAQIGCFVPCKSANLPIIDKIFTRIGAADDLVSGKSTFMVEMTEVNNALKEATKSSLILFDEIGRGTATYDGMALAQAIIEYVHEKIGSITLFSTHYHELTALDKTLKRLKNIHVSAKDDKNTLVFLHKVVDGPTDKSYGINVAKLAHLPNQVINRAQVILNFLEETKGKTEIEMDLFNFDEEEKIEVKETPEVIQILNDVDVDDLSPREALSLIYELKRKINE